MNDRRLNEIKGVLLTAAGLIFLVSLVSFTPFDLSFYTSHPNIPPKNLISTFGAYFAGLFLFLFGWASYLIAGLVLFIGARLFLHQIPDVRLPRILGLGGLLFSSSTLLSMFRPQNEILSFQSGGFFGFISARTATLWLGPTGGYILFGALWVLSFALVTEMLISSLLLAAYQKAKAVLESRQFRPAALPVKPARKEAKPAVSVNVGAKPSPAVAEPPLAPPRAPLKPKIQIQTPAGAKETPKAKPAEVKIGDYHLPGLDLLDSPPPLEARQIKEDLTNSARVLEETLSDFQISVKVTDIERGPVITRYELEPAPGVKLNRIVALGDDIALAMKAPSVRIVAPIPGKARVGVEVPNTQSSLVFLKEIIEAKDFQEAESKLALAIGKDIAGHPVVTDLGDDMPHLLIAGTTGSGKTVCVNSLIISLLMKASPAELKLLMVDPKMVELMPFNGLPHLICPVVTDAKKASAALAWAVSQMEERYQLLSKLGARNIAAYNARTEEEKLPYIVIIIDELADLMMIARDQIESAIARLAQLSRAVGIHLIMATQRPSVDVVTGIIKANFPARISFKVASKVDSRTVLDTNGADKLLGRGDMLFMQPGEEKLIRAQGAWVKDNEIERVVEFIKKQADPVFNEDILKEQQRSAAGIGDKDELYDEAVRVVIETNQASSSILQRRMRLGYTRAARIIDQMEQDGLVGPNEGSKARRILIDREQWLKDNMMSKDRSE